MNKLTLLQIISLAFVDVKHAILLLLSPYFVFYFFGFKINTPCTFTY